MYVRAHMTSIYCVHTHSWLLHRNENNPFGIDEQNDTKLKLILSGAKQLTEIQHNYCEMHIEHCQKFPSFSFSLSSSSASSCIFVCVCRRGCLINHGNKFVIDAYRSVCVCV